MVIDEVPAVGMFESLMNFFDATTGKQSGFFGKETTPQLLQAHLQAVEEMIARDKNHPCVMAWSLFNEPETTNENAVPYFEQVFARARELDPQQRPRTFALIGNSTPETCKCVQLSDFVCLNRYYGWYNQGGYEISDAEENFRKEMDGWKARGLHRPFVFTEYGGGHPVLGAQAPLGHVEPGVPAGGAGDAPPGVRFLRLCPGRAGVELRRLPDRRGDHAGQRQQEGGLHPPAPAQRRRLPPKSPLGVHPPHRLGEVPQSAAGGVIVLPPPLRAGKV